MLLNIQPIEPGDAASPNLWNSRFADIQAVMNGNVDSDNLKNSSVTREKIAPGAVTNDKLGIISEYENDSSYVKFGNFMIQWGVTLVTHTGTDIVFAKPFLAAPGVVCTEQDPNSQSPWITERTPTKFRCRHPWAGNPLYISWVAIGPA